MPTGSKRNIMQWLLIVVLLLSTMVVLHTHLDSAFHPNCPACQLEHNPACQTPTVATTALVPEPAMVFFLSGRSLGKAYQFHYTHKSSPRSPPLCK